VTTPARTPEPPYVAVVFTSVRTAREPEAYAAAADRMIALAHEQPGFLGVESARDPDGFGITVSYWRDAGAAEAFGRELEHREVQRRGRATWYASFTLRLCRVERAWTMPPPDPHEH